MLLLKGGIWVNLLHQTDARNTLQVLMAGALVAGHNSVFRVVMFPDGAVEIKAYSGQVTASGPFEIRKANARFVLQSAGNKNSDAATPYRYLIEPYRKMIVQASGEETKPFRFAARSDRTAWVRWNEKRDAAGKEVSAEPGTN